MSAHLLDSQHLVESRQTLPHPLERLTAVEIAEAVRLLKEWRGFSHAMRIISIILREPRKEQVYASAEGQFSDRQATAILLNTTQNRAWKLTMNLTRSEMTEAQQAPSGSQPTLSMDEQIECETAVLASPEFKAALQK